MKSTLALAGFLVACALTSNAQQIGNYASSVNPVYDYVSEKSSEKTVNESTVNTDALAHFNAHFKSATNVAWTTNGKLQSVYFTTNAIKMRSTYNENGRLEYTVRYLTLQQSPAKVRDIINSEYGNMTTTLITEVERRGVKSYFVKLENDKQIITVQIQRGELSVYETINK